MCSHDVLEHIPWDRRTEFIAELLRVSTGPVVLVAPFGDPRSVRAEQLINSYFVARLGHSIPALDEHDDFVLPDTDLITGWLEETQVPYVRFGDGWVYHWVRLLLPEGASAGGGLRERSPPHRRSVQRRCCSPRPTTSRRITARRSCCVRRHRCPICRRPRPVRATTKCAPRSTS